VQEPESPAKTEDPDKDKKGETDPDKDKADIPHPMRNIHVTSIADPEILRFLPGPPDLQCWVLAHVAWIASIGGVTCSSEAAL